MEACYACEHDDPTMTDLSERVYVDDTWRIALAFNSSLPGWMCLVPRRHLEGLVDLTGAEAATMGRILRAASVALVETTGCAKTYVILFAEQEGFAHLHVHIVPRSPDLPEDRRGPKVFGYLGGDPVDQPDLSDRLTLAAALRESIRTALAPA